MHPLLALSGLPWTVPDFSTLRLRQRSLDLQVAYRPSSGELNLLLDSTGTTFLGEGEWKCKKHGAERRRQWRKLYIGIDA
ncbi:transposase, IS4 [Comamonas testosteroni ATCC 11996]|nr:transposase, IS4 [Comamonas testosteroni ATCC 11996]